MNRLILKPGREKSVLQRHPWVFSGAVERMEGSPESGETVQVCAANGDVLGLGAFSPVSQMRARLWSVDPKETIDAAFLRDRLQRAIQRRLSAIDTSMTNAYRLVHAESDGLPGLVVDRYVDVLVMQVLSAGVELWRDELVSLLVELTGASAVYERSDVDVRRLEGLAERTGLLYGQLPAQLEIMENGLKFNVDVISGQKTGFYLDQRANRQRVRQLTAGRSVLNCFCYTGAFSIYALAGGASQVLSVDSSAEALKQAEENAGLNGLDAGKMQWQEADVFLALRKMRDSRQSFDAIILDPPKFAPTAAYAEKAARAYKDINLLAFKLLRPGGLLFTFSCSGGISADLFQKIVAGAAADAHVDAVIVEHLEQGMDHPVGLSFPEGAYLKGLICQI